MSGTARLVPPLNDPPIADAGDQHSQAWSAHFQDVVDQLAKLTANAGVTDGSDAPAGRVGEFLTAAAGATFLASGVTVDLTTLALSAGDWDVWGGLFFVPSAGTTIRTVSAWVSDVSATLRGDGLATFIAVQNAPFSPGAPQSLPAPMVRMSSASPITAHLSTITVFITSTMTGSGTICARRAR